MSYFSRLTDIVTCNLSEMLARQADPRVALQEIVAEMQEGLAGAKRSVATAESNVGQLEAEIGEQRRLIDHWAGQAKLELLASRENEARLAIVRKQEAEDLVAGLEQQLQAAIGTRDHLTTMLRALEARLSEAVRRKSELEADTDGSAPAQRTPAAMAKPPEDRSDRVNAELETLRRQLQSSDD